MPENLGEFVKKWYNTDNMNVGRPTVMTPEIIAQLEDAFSYGASDKEAYSIVGISSSTFYNYCQDNPEFVEKKDALKEEVKFHARKNIAKGIKEGDKVLSQWYLEKKAKDEFSTRSELTGKDGEKLGISPETQIVIDQALDSYLKGTKI